MREASVPLLSLAAYANWEQKNPLSLSPKGSFTTETSKGIIRSTFSRCVTCSLPVDDTTTNNVLLQLIDFMTDSRIRRDQRVLDLAGDALGQIPESDGITKLELVAKMQQRYAIENKLPFSIEDYMALFYRRPNTERDHLLEKSLEEFKDDTLFRELSEAMGITHGEYSCWKEAVCSLDRSNPKQATLQNFFTVLTGHSAFYYSSNPLKELFPLISNWFQHTEKIPLIAETDEEYKVEWIYGETLKCRLNVSIGSAIATISATDSLIKAYNTKFPLKIYYEFPISENFSFEKGKLGFPNLSEIPVELHSSFNLALGKYLNTP